MPVNKINVSQTVDWVLVNDPTKEELKKVSDDYSLDWYQVQNCLNPDHLPAYELAGNSYFIMTRWFSAQPGQHLHTLQEITSKIAIFYSTDFIITIQKTEAPFFKTDLVDKYFTNGNSAISTSTNVLALILLLVLKTYESAAFKLSEQMDEYESTILLKTLKPAMLKGLYYLKRKAGICKRLIILTSEVINYIKSLEVEENIKRDIDDVELKLVTWFDQVLDDVNNLLNTYLSLSAYKTNDVMKILTIFSVFFMPLTFIVGIYGMNFEFMPELRSRWGYPLVMTSMVIITTGIFLWFRKKKWL